MDYSSFIIPAIDLIGGKVVRLTQGDYNKKNIYYSDPLEAALMLQDAGLRRLHLVDLDGARQGAVQHLATLEKIATHTNLIIDFGGGVKQQSDVEAIINAGAEMVTIGSLAVKQPVLLGEWVKAYSPERFFVGADVLDEKIRISGWLEDGGTDIYSFLQQMISLGLHHFFCTDIKKDGAMQGPSTALYQNIIARFPGIQLVASGGVSNADDLMLLYKAGCKAAIVGKAIYEQTISLPALINSNRDHE